MSSLVKPLFFLHVSVHHGIAEASKHKHEEQIIIVIIITIPTTTLIIVTIIIIIITIIQNNKRTHGIAEAYSGRGLGPRARQPPTKSSRGSAEHRGIHY